MTKFLTKMKHYIIKCGLSDDDVTLKISLHFIIRKHFSQNPIFE